MPNTFRRFLPACLLILTAAAVADERDRLKVGVQPDGRILVPTNQFLSPAGRQVTFPGRPVDLALIEDGRTLVVTNMRSLEFLDPQTGAVQQTLTLPGPGGSRGVGFSAAGLLAHGDRILATDTQSAVRVAVRRPDGKYAWAEPLKLTAPAVGGAVYPA